MQVIFEKYIRGECNEQEYQQIVDFIQTPGSDISLNGLLHSEWKKSLNKEATIQPDPRLLDSVFHQIGLKEETPTRTIRFYKRLLAVAAVLMIGLVIGSIIFIQMQQPEIITQKVSIPHGGKTRFNLPDGSVVWLNSGTRFSYPDRFEDERLVELAGEAYFDVVEGTEPFIVKTKFGEVQVLGTEFNVKAYKGEQFMTTLVEGSVIFTNRYGKQATLQPGTQVIFDSSTFKMRQVETKLFTSWKEGQLIFRDEPLGNIIKRLERWYNVDIELKDKRIKDLKYTGTIEMETFSEVLELIKVTTPIKYSFDRKTRILTISAP